MSTNSLIRFNSSVDDVSHGTALEVKSLLGTAHTLMKDGAVTVSPYLFGTSVEHLTLTLMYRMLRSSCQVVFRPCSFTR